MKFPHPIRFCTTLRSNLVQLIFNLGHLASVIEENSRATAELLNSTKATQAATERLVNIEIHRQLESGRRSDF